MSRDQASGLALSTASPDVLYKSLGERALRENKPFFIVVYASDVDGTPSNPPPHPYGISSWCPDCRIAAGLIESTFKDWPAPVPVIQVGSKLKYITLSYLSVYLCYSSLPFRLYNLQRSEQLS